VIPKHPEIMDWKQSFLIHDLDVKFYVAPSSTEIFLSTSGKSLPLWGLCDLWLLCMEDYTLKKILGASGLVLESIKWEKWIYTTSRTGFKFAMRFLYLTEIFSLHSLSILMQRSCDCPPQSQGPAIQVGVETPFLIL
jgi:hypothetical protein